MTPTGIAFALFLGIVLALHWIGPRTTRWQNGVLLTASYIFYVSWSPEWLPLLILATLADFVVGRGLGTANRSERQRRALLAAGLAANLGALLWLKYRGFFAESLDALFGRFGLPSDLPTLAVLLPLGLSYFTLIKIGYLLDVYHRRVAPAQSLLTFATFVAFFPQLLAGPITRAGAMLPQLAAVRRPTFEWVLRAGGVLLLGWWMKAYVADWIAPAVVNPVFDAPGTYGQGAHWLALVGYAVQLFCDFAGYSFLAIGLGRLFAIELPPNFDRPFLSRSMPEFWRRWHISLNTWLFDYLFGPLTTGGGRLHGRIATNLILVFAVSGLWHGAQWTFVLWGVLHGLALAAHHQWDVWYRGRCRVDRRWLTVRRGSAYAWASWMLAQAWFLATLVLFRSADLSATNQFFSALLGGSGGGLLEFNKIALLNLVVAFAFVTWHHLEGTPKGARLRTRLFALPAPALGILVGLVVAWLLVFAPVARGTFIYAQF